MTGYGSGLVRALGYTTTRADLDQLRQSGVADYLLESTTGSVGRVTRLFHQALSDELLASRDTLGDEKLLLRALREEAVITGWAAAALYLKQHVAEHAAKAKDLASLLGDTDYIVEADYTHDSCRFWPAIRPPERRHRAHCYFRSAPELVPCPPHGAEVY
jgi:hypothetical protein